MDVSVCLGGGFGRRNIHVYTHGYVCARVCGLEGKSKGGVDQ